MCRFGTLFLPGTWIGGRAAFTASVPGHWPDFREVRIFGTPAESVG